MLLMAIRRPARMWARSRARLSSNSVLRRMTTCRKAMNCCNATLRVIVLGMPSTRASMLAEKDCCIAECLYRLLSTI